MTKERVLDFRLPDLGEGLVEATIVKWLVSEGDDVRQNQNLVEIETEKVTVEIPSPAAGRVLRLNYAPGAAVAVGSVILSLEAESSEAATPSDASERSGTRDEPKPATVDRPQGTPVPDLARERVLAKPAVRQLARELGVKIETLSPGSGISGEVTRDDVLGAAGTSNTASEASRVRRVPITPVRRRIAERLTESWRAIPHVTSFLEIDVTNLVSYRQELRSKGSDVALPAFFIKALALAVERHPAMNATWNLAAGEILQHLDCHVGLAIDTPNGLIVPVVRDANAKSLSSIASEVARLTDAANEGRLSQHDVRGATITLTNMGPGVIDAGTPIINPPEVAVVGVGSFGWRALVVNGQVVPRMACTVDCSFDHRAVDGVEASQFLRHFGDALENPEVLTQEQSTHA